MEIATQSNTELTKCYTIMRGKQSAIHATDVISSNLFSVLSSQQLTVQLLVMRFHMAWKWNLKRLKWKQLG